MRKILKLFWSRVSEKSVAVADFTRFQIAAGPSVRIIGAAKGQRNSISIKIPVFKLRVYLSLNSVFRPESKSNRGPTLNSGWVLASI